MNTIITFCAVFRNEASRCRYVLDLVKSLFDNIIIAVQESDDETLQICREYTDNIIVRHSEGPEESKDFIMEQVKTPWTFWLDADEFPSLSMIRMLEQVDPAVLFGYDSVSFIRTNYIDGLIIEGGQGIDRQYRMMRSDVRWNTKAQGKVIHIHPLVKKTLESDLIIYHHRTLEKVKRMTERWNSLEPKSVNDCNLYVKNVEKEICQKKSK